MPRQLSLSAVQSLLAQETEKVWLVCLTIDHADLTSPIRLVNDKQDLTRTAGTFTAFPFQVTLPSEDEQETPRATLTIDNVDRTVIQALRSITSAPDITIEVVLQDSPNTVEAGPFEFQLHSITYDAQAIRGDLGYQSDFLNEGFPKLAFTPNTAQGLF